MKLLIGTLLLPLAALAAPAHQHGVGRLDIVVDGPTLAVELSLPQDAVVGHERAPRTEAERRAAVQALALLKTPARLVAPDAAAGCQPAEATVTAPLLEGRGGGADGHADVDVSVTFRCTEPARLRQLGLPLFEALRRLERLQVQVAGPRGQRQAVVRRAAPTLTLAP